MLTTFSVNWIVIAICINEWIAFTHCINITFMETLLPKMETFSILYREQCLLIRETREWIECQAFQKRGCNAKNFKKHLLSSMQKTVSTQTNGSVFVQRIERARKTRYEIELFKIVDCFLDGYGNYESSLVCFKIKTLI